MLDSGDSAYGYHVVIANHFMVGNPEKMNCNFTTLDGGIPTEPRLDTAYLAKVNTFINNGGNFICHICGHEHLDYVVKSVDYPNQICIAIDTASTFQGQACSDTTRTTGKKTQDLCNVISFDTTSHIIKIIRIGADSDRYLRNKNQITIDYQTGQVLYQE